MRKLIEKIKNYLIKKLGGYTETDMKNATHSMPISTVRFSERELIRIAAEKECHYMINPYSGERMHAHDLLIVKEYIAHMLASEMLNSGVIMFDATECPEALLQIVRGSVYVAKP